MVQPPEATAALLYDISMRARVLTWALETTDGQVNRTELEATSSLRFELIEE